VTGHRSWLTRLLSLRPSRIGRRLLAFNLLLVFLPVAGILYLDVYETRLLEAQERGMVQQGRLVAAALGDHDRVMTDDAVALLSRLGRRGDGRIRVYDAAGVLLADSVRAPDLTASDRPPEDAAGDYASASGIRERVLYRVGAWIVRVRRAFLSFGRAMLTPSGGSRSSSGSPRSDDARSDQDALPGPEVRAALEGRYGTGVRPTPGQRSLTLYSAVPIRHGDRVVGAALVSQSTFRILQALYDVRLRIFQIVIASFGAAVVIGLIMSATIVRPLVRLRRAAMALSNRRATPASFGHVDRKDEIGDLARTLEDLTGRLEAHIRLLESFAGDVSHEFKNPLAAIRIAAEAIAATDDPVERQRLLGMLTRDVDRLERLVTGVRELARIDAQLAHEEIAPVDLAALLSGLVEGLNQRQPRVRFSYAGPSTRAHVRASPDRVAQIFENLLDNAASFAPHGSTVAVVMAVDGPVCSVRVEDRGSGFPPGHVERVFDRFFSYRPDDGGRREHMGLGLSIARAIVEGYGGSIAAANRDGGGASVHVRLPFVTGIQPSSLSPQIVSRAGSVSRK
jgi:two-component system, OmpR family, sensor histidine kinase ChvG